MRLWQAYGLRLLEQAGASGLLTTTVVERTLIRVPFAEAARRGHGKAGYSSRYHDRKRGQEVSDDPSEASLASTLDDQAAFRKGGQEIVLKWLYGMRSRGFVLKTGVGRNATGQMVAQLVLTQKGYEYVATHRDEIETLLDQLSE